MKNRAAKSLTGVVMLALCSLWVCSAAGDRRVKVQSPLSPSETLSFWHPEGFTCEVGHAKNDDFRPGFWFRDYSNDSSEPLHEIWTCKLSFWITVNGMETGPSVQQRDTDIAVQERAFELCKTTVDTNLIRHLRLTNGFGSYCTLQDTELARRQTIQPGTYNFFTIGVLRVGRYSFDVVASSRADDDEMYRNMLKVVESLVVLDVTTNQADRQLLEAAFAGDFQKTVSSLSEGANVNATDQRGWTPLIHAAKAGHVDIALELIAKGADIERRTTTEAGSSVLCFATEGRKFQILTALLKRGADINGKSRNGMTPLAFAAQSGYTDVAHYLITNGADVNLFGPRDENGKVRSPLMCAAIKGSIEMMRLLLAAGATVDGTNAGGDTALMMAAKRDRAAVLKFLIKNKANVNARGTHGHTAFIYAAYNGQVENLKVLLEAGADPFATATDSKDPNDPKGRYGAADLASQQGQFEALEIIRNAERVNRPL